MAFKEGRVADDDSFAPGENDAFLVPFRKDSADGEEGRANQLSEFAARKLHLDAGLVRPSHLPRQTQKSHRQTLGDPLRRDLAEAFLQLFEARVQDGIHVGADARELFQEDLESVEIPDDRANSLHGLGRACITALPLPRVEREADWLAFPGHPENDLVAAGTELSEFNGAGLDEHEAVTNLSLHEQKVMAIKDPDVGARGYMDAICGRQT